MRTQWDSNQNSRISHCLRSVHDSIKKRSADQRNTCSPKPSMCDSKPYQPPEPARASVVMQAVKTKVLASVVEHPGLSGVDGGIIKSYNHNLKSTLPSSLMVGALPTASYSMGPGDRCSSLHVQQPFRTCLAVSSGIGWDERMSKRTTLLHSVLTLAPQCPYVDSVIPTLPASRQHVRENPAVLGGQRSGGSLAEVPNRRCRSADTPGARHRRTQAL